MGSKLLCFPNPAHLFYFVIDVRVYNFIDTNNVHVFVYMCHNMCTYL